MKFIESFDESGKSYGLDNLKSDILTIRDTFAEFEDLSNVTYTIKVSDIKYHKYPPLNSFKSITYAYNSSVGDFGNLISTLDNRHSKDIISNSHIIIVVDLMVIGKPNYGDNQFIDSKSIGCLEDIITAYHRLVDNGYDVVLDLNSNHHQYKPVKIIVRISR